MSGELPKISIVTVSLNRKEFIEETIQSVLEQDHPSTEYVVMDGGSTDGTVEIIRKYASRLAYWASEPDSGMYDALNKGFARTSGEVMAWVNSDDKYTPWAFQVVGEIFAAFPEVEWLTTLYPLGWDARGRATVCKKLENFSRASFLRGESMRPGNLFSTRWIQQESTFWRRSLWERAGGKLDASLRLAGDFELWSRFYRLADLYAVTVPLGGFRLHGSQLTGKQADRYRAECDRVLAACGGGPDGKVSSVGRRLKRLLPRRLRKHLQTPDDLSRFVTHKGSAGGWELLSA